MITYKHLTESVSPRSAETVNHRPSSTLVDQSPQMDESATRTRLVVSDCLVLLDCGTSCDAQWNKLRQRSTTDRETDTVIVRCPPLPTRQGALCFNEENFYWNFPVSLCSIFALYSPILLRRWRWKNPHCNTTASQLATEYRLWLKSLQ